MSLIELIQSGGWTLGVLLACSFLVWAVIFERLWSYRRLGRDLRSFHLQAVNQLLTSDLESIRSLCRETPKLPTARLLLTAIDRLGAKDERLRARWWEAVERKRNLINLELRRYLWILGTIGSAAPFIGLFGTVVGILRSFREMAKTGSGGFAVVASGISESLIATAAGIVVAVIAVLAYNAFQTRLGSILLLIRLHSEEMGELLQSFEKGSARGV